MDDLGALSPGSSDERRLPEVLPLAWSLSLSAVCVCVCVCVCVGGWGMLCSSPPPRLSDQENSVCGGRRKRLLRSKARSRILPATLTLALFMTNPLGTVKVGRKW